MFSDIESLYLAMQECVDPNTRYKITLLPDGFSVITAVQHPQLNMVVVSREEYTAPPLKMSYSEYAAYDQTPDQALEQDACPRKTT